LSLKVALTGGAASILIFGVAAISLHAIDAILHTPLFHVYFVCWLWNISALLIIVGACLEIKKLGRHPA
jgi:hypothetical protein